MFNIISFSRENNAPARGYEKLFSVNDAKKATVTVPTIKDAVQYKNRKVLILVENYELDEGAIKLIAEKQKACFLIDLSKIIKTYGVTRAILLSRLRSFLKFCVKYNAYYTFADFAQNEFELRSARELVHISLLLGINEGQAKFALRMMKHFVQ